jgi:Arc/MetJ-type ribon-helix-helix transcriptional regulator
MTDKTTIEVKLPSQLAAGVEQLVADGWYSDTQTVVVEALRRFLDSHSPALMQQFVQEDLDWGLRGTE